MGKARMLGAFAPYTPNSKVDMRNKPKLFERRKQIADDMADRRRLEKEMKELKRMKMGAAEDG